VIEMRDTAEVVGTCGWTRSLPHVVEMGTAWAGIGGGRAANCCGLSGPSVVCCRNGVMSLVAWAERNRVARVTACRWFRAGLLRVSALKVGWLILVDERPGGSGPRSRTAVYAPVSSADQKSDLDRPVVRVTAWATAQQIAVDEVVTEVGSALNGYRCKFLGLLRDPYVGRIVVEHRDRFCRFSSEYIQAAMAAPGRELVVLDSSEVDDDVVRDMTEILTNRRARLYGKRAATNRVERAVAAGAGRRGVA
jgi:predicted site-specific integrase-resolvase